jgi:16S rRNA (guanine(1405)-N(7))-methyltransferase
VRVSAKYESPMPGGPVDRTSAAAPLVERIAASAKYRSLSRSTIADIVRREFALGKRPAEVEPAVRRKLHRVLAAYHGGGKAARDLDAVAAALASRDDAAARDACRALMGLHATAAERLALIDDGYHDRIFAATGRPDVVLDLACALHPFAWRWMGLPASTIYRAFDLNRQFVDLVARYLALEGVRGGAEWRDILCEPPAEQADVAFFLQTYHCVEARRPGAGQEVLDSAPARHVVVSLPKENFGGRRLARSAVHAEAIEAQAAARGWETQVIDWPAETVWILRKPDIAGSLRRGAAACA